MPLSEDKRLVLMAISVTCSVAGGLLLGELTFGTGDWLELEGKWETYSKGLGMVMVLTGIALWEYVKTKKR